VANRRGRLGLYGNVLSFEVLAGAEIDVPWRFVTRMISTYIAQHRVEMLLTDSVKVISAYPTSLGSPVWEIITPKAKVFVLADTGECVSSVDISTSTTNQSPQISTNTIEGLRIDWSNFTANLTSFETLMHRVIYHGDNGTSFPIINKVSIQTEFTPPSPASATS
jgi:hypothetical protein